MEEGFPLYCTHTDIGTIKVGRLRNDVAGHEHVRWGPVP